MPTIESSRLLPDGSLEVTVAERRTVTVPAAEVKKPNGKLKGKSDLLAAIKKAVKPK